MQPDSSKTDKSSSSTAFNRQLLQTYIALDNWHKFRLRLFVEGIFVGILGGLAISLVPFPPWGDGKVPHLSIQHIYHSRFFSR